MTERQDEDNKESISNIDESTVIARSNSKGKTRFIFTLLLGVLIGVLIMYFIYQNLPKINDTEMVIDENQSINVDITTQVTEIVGEVTSAVVGITNVQEEDNFWLQGENQNNEAGTGSGVIYKQDENDAFIVTNHHVIENADTLEVVLANENKIKAELLGSDLFTDLAVLKIAANEVDQVVNLGKSENIRVGEPVLAIGNPLGHMFAGSVSQGIISGKQRSIPQDFNQDGTPDWQSDVLQTDAAINPGNSGGALINIKGELIGINSMKISQMVAEGIGFAIPIDAALPVIKELEETGSVSRPYLGVELYSLNEIPQGEWHNSLELPEEVTSGVYVWSVEPGSPADKAGLERLDVITALDGKKIKNIVDLRKILYEEKAINDEIAITAYRKTEKIETQAILIPQK